MEDIRGMEDIEVPRDAGEVGPRDHEVSGEKSSGIDVSGLFGS